MKYIFTLKLLAVALSWYLVLDYIIHYNVRRMVEKYRIHKIQSVFS